MEDLSFWKESEKLIIKAFEEMWYKVDINWATSIHDFKFMKKGVITNVELKTRRCSKEQYPDTLIWANKLWEAWNKFYTNWEETIFLFKYTDWLYHINPFDFVPRREHKLQRRDRGIDKKKWWLYYETEDLKEIITTN